MNVMEDERVDFVFGGVAEAAAAAAVVSLFERSKLIKNT